MIPEDQKNITSQRISNMTCMNYDNNNNNLGLHVFKFHSGYMKIRRAIVEK